MSEMQRSESGSGDSAVFTKQASESMPLINKATAEMTTTVKNPAAASSPSDSDNDKSSIKSTILRPPKSRLARRRSAVTFPSTYRSLTASSQRRSRGAIYSCSSYDEACAVTSSSSHGGGAATSSSPGGGGVSPEHRLDWVDFIGCLLHQNGGGKRSVSLSKRGMSSTQIMIRKKLEKAIQKAGYNMNDILTTQAAGSSSSNCASPQVERRPPTTDVEWTENALADEHIWAATNASGDLCYVGEDNCGKTGPRKKCSACHIVTHDDCFEKLTRIGFRCKSTFREATPRSMRDQTYFVRHHWVHRRKMEGKCRQCGKSFEKRFGFRDTKIIAISCSWCKQAYHNKVSCFRMQNLSDPCKMGAHASAILPPTWVVKQSTQKSRGVGSRLRSKKKRLSGGSGSSCRRKSSREASVRNQAPFVIKPIASQTPYHRPLVVFINPKSGGNQGSKLIHQFQNILNPRQVFDLSKGRPQEALELFRKVPHVRVLACGGDGTVGWILSILDRMSLSKPPPVAILPLGTGNDLSRTLNFGPGYTDEPVSKIIQGIEESKVVKLDRWRLRVERNEAVAINRHDDDEALEEPSSVDDPPLEVVNNYFSIGVDAKVALEFHHSREARPNKFNSRIGNKIFYARASVLEYLTRQTKDFSKHLTLICDGKSYTSKIRELKPVCLLFLNIPRYASGTSPWGHPTGTELTNQRIDDRMIEVLAFSINQLGMLRIGGHGERICQCRNAQIITDMILPMQIDGEPFRLNPSEIRVDFFKQSNMLQKSKRRTSARFEGTANGESKVRIGLVTSKDYDACNGRKNLLLRSSSPLLVTVAGNLSTLSALRQSLEAVYPIERTAEPISYRWVFLDASGSDKCYQVDRNQEKSMLLHEIMSTDREVFVLDLKPPPPKSAIMSNNTFTKKVKDYVRRHSRDDKDDSAFVSGSEHEMKSSSYHHQMSIGSVGKPLSMQESTSSFHPSSDGEDDSPVVTTPKLKSTDSKSDVFIDDDGETTTIQVPTNNQNEEEEAATIKISNQNEEGINDQLENNQQSRSSSSSSPPISSANANQSSNVVASSGGSVSCTRCDDAQRSLLEAAMRGDVIRIQNALDDGARIENTFDDEGCSALHLTSMYGCDSALEFLLTKNLPTCFIDMMDKKKRRTALHVAAWFGRETLCYKLVKAGASIHLNDYQGHSASDLARQANAEKLARFFTQTLRTRACAARKGANETDL